MNDVVPSHTTPAPESGSPESAHAPLGVIAGFDGSTQGRLALHYAAAEANRRGAPLTVVSAFTVPRAVAGYTDSAAEVTGDSLARLGAEQVLEEAREFLSSYGGPTTYRVEHGDAAGVLVALSEQADLVVVGGRGRGGFIGRVLGSVSSALPAHAACPTVVINHHYEPTTDHTSRFLHGADERPVTVGVDGSDHGRLAALHAAETASAWNAPLRLVLAMPPLDHALMWYPELAGREVAVVEQQKQQLQKKIEGEAAWLHSHFPDLEIIGTVEEGPAITVMREATEKAQLTVVGTRGRGGITSALLGSVSRGTLLGAHGPVMVVPALEDQRLSTVEGFEPRL